MAFQLTDDYLNTSDGNAMSVDDRIKNAFAVDGKVSYKGKQYDSEVELRKLLIKEGVIETDNTSTDVIKKAASTLLGLFLVVGLSTLLFACNGNSKSNVNVPTEYCEELVKLAEEGNAEAQANLGICYAKGEGLSPSNEEAVKWFKKSSEQNNAKGQFYLSMAYNRGMGVSQDWEESIRLMKKSANQGFAKAQSQLGGLYEYGLMNTPKNHQEAMKWFEKAAKQGDPDGQMNVGLEYYGNEDFNEAVKWFEKAVAQGDVGAHHFLGLCYFFGQGVEQDKMRGYNLVKQAAEQGDPAAIKSFNRMKSELYGTY